MPPPKKPIYTGPKVEPRRDFVRRVFPWLAAAGMLVVYVMTLNHWVSLLSMNSVASLSGWFWLPDMNNPIFHLATLPLRVLPVAIIPLALNLFSAVCAALTLWLLARSVALLPHDRTEAQVARARNEFFLLSVPGAWMPPLLAVLMCGLQLTFWEWATNGGYEMFDLLMFAAVIWLMLEYRLDEKEWRLYWSSFIVGAGVAEGPSMTGFFIIFIIAVIWSRGFNFFNWQFLRRMTLCGLAGFLFLLVLPVYGLVSGEAQGHFLEALKFSFVPQYEVLKLYCLSVYNISEYFEDLQMPLFVALVPLLMLSIRWKLADDKSPYGPAVARAMFHCIHAVFLLVCLWLFFDPPFSPREKGFMLTLYYVLALSAGYYAGYFLIVCSKKPLRAGEAASAGGRFFSLAVVAGVWVLSILAVIGLIKKNALVIRSANDNSLAHYAGLLTQNLPREGAIVLSDDPGPLYLAQAELTREGRSNFFLLLDTGSLIYSKYHLFLHNEAPNKWPLLVSVTNTAPLNPVGMIGMFTMLGASNELYYLHPSFGYYFEKFYAEPHGLVYKLRDLPGSTLVPPPPDQNLFAENQAFWANARKQGLQRAEDALVPLSPYAPKTFSQKIFKVLHVPHEPDNNAVAIGTFCSRSADFWGVELERAGFLTNAAATFRTALQLNPDNVVAQINLQFNQDLSAGVRPFVDPTKTSADRLGKFDTFGAAIKEDGPFDEPSFCFLAGYTLAHDNQLYRQAVAPFYRVHELDPGYFPARSWLARIYSFNYLPDQVIDMLRAPLERPAEFAVSDEDYIDITIMAATAYFENHDPAEGKRLLDEQISRNPMNNELIVRIARYYMRNNMYTNSLAVAEHQLSLSPGDPQWLLIKGYSENELKQYDAAIASLSRVLAIQKDDADALSQRASAYMSIGNLDAARADYRALQKTNPDSFDIADNLGVIAWRQHDTNEAIRNFQIYAAYAPTNATEYQTVTERLDELKHPAGGK
jgi:tetratricopeptide (TPR) repeat protein